MSFDDSFNEDNPLILSVTEIRTYMACPRKWFYSYILKRKRRGSESTALTLGSAGHKWIELVIGKNRSPVDATFMIYNELEDEDHKKKFLSMAFVLEIWHRERNFPWSEVIESESEGMIELMPGVKLRTKPDLIVMDEQGRVAPLQLKFLAKGTDLMNYMNYIELSAHESSYWENIKQRYPQHEIGHSGLLIFLKTSHHKRAAGEDCGCKMSHGKGWRHLTEQEALDCVHFEPLNIDGKLRSTTMKNLTIMGSTLAYHYEMFTEADENKAQTLQFNETSCLSPYGACPFLPVCSGKCGIMDTGYFETYEPNSHYDGGETT